MRNIFVFALIIYINPIFGQTLFVPSSTSGIGSSSNGYIGIGTSSPDRALHVRDANGVIRIDRNAPSPGVMISRFSSDWSSVYKTFAIGVSGSGTDNGYFFINDHHTNLGGAADSRFSISTTGNVGVGTSSPGEKFHISGSGLVKSLVESADNHAYYVVEGASGSGSFVDYHRKGDGRIWHTGLRNGNNNFEFRRHDQTTVMTLKEDGDVGVGTNSPEAKLQVNHSGTIGGSWEPAKSYFRITDGTQSMIFDSNEIYTSDVLYFGAKSNSDIARFRTIGASGSSDKMVIRSNGKVGIGTTTPEARLQVNSSGTIGGTWQPSNSYLRITDGAQSMIFDSNEIYTSDALHFGAKSNGYIARFRKVDESSYSDKMVIKSNGNVGIGVVNPSQKLQVAGTVYSTEVKVEVAAGTGPDYVFEPDYDLRTLEETKEYITENKHLPEIPPAKEMEANGVDLGGMNMLLLKKIEELTLYQIQLLEKLEAQQTRITELEKKVN